MSVYRVQRRVFTVPGPGNITRVRFDDQDGGPGEARLIDEGSFKGFWRDHKGCIWDWPQLLVRNQPLEEAS